MLALILLGWAAIFGSLQGCGEVPKPLCGAFPAGVIEAPIIGGTPSTDRRGTVYVFGGNHFCTGTVLGPFTVLTAAHCVDMVTIRIEEWGDYAITENIPHPNYSFPHNDLRVLHTDRPLPPPYVSVGVPEGGCTQLLVQGYGKGSESISERLVHELDRGRGFLYTSEGSCKGDSGGPVYALYPGGYTLVATSDFGSDDCRGRSGNIDLTYSTNALFIEEHLQ